jgi:phospholipid/cholesterol/gamma-HCH transport system permease protein
MHLNVDRTADALTLTLSGDWSIDQIGAIEASLATLDDEVPSTVRVNCAKLGVLDLSAVWLLRVHLQRWAGAGAHVEFVGKRPAHFDFVDEITKESAPEQPIIESPAGWEAFLARYGRFWVEQKERASSAADYYGRVFMTSLTALRHPKRLRGASIARHIYETGIQAVPIVALIAFLITLVIAYIGAQQLKRFGADIFTVDLVTVGVLREMGVLLTAIIVAGRSGSAFAAEIGVMQLNDEVDALKAMGINPYEALVLPRVIGLVIALPLLTILADAMGLMGGALLCQWLLDISFSQFVVRMQDSLAPTTFWAGFIKAPVFAFLIAMTGTYRGMQVRDSSRELGRLTTVAVVQSIFLVILANAVFAIIYLEIDF